MIIREGLSQIFIPDDKILPGPGTKRVGFYNPDQVLNRDITVALVNALKPRNYLDGFGGTGIRGIRVSKETGTNSVIAEINRKSVEVIERNRKENEVDLEIRNEPFESVVSRLLFDFIDVDPYGSIVPYLDVALTHVKNGGYIGLTATDLSALTGSAPKKTARRYGAHVENDRLRHETGIRLLLSYIAKRAAAMDKHIVPLISFWRSHYYRTIIKVSHGAGRADEGLLNIRAISKSEVVGPLYPQSEEGPLWTGSLNSQDVVEKSCKQVMEGIEAKSLQFLGTLPHEDARMYFFETADYASYLGKSIPRLDALVELLRENLGAVAWRTHFSPTGLKVNVNHAEFMRIFEQIAVK